MLKSFMYEGRYNQFIPIYCYENIAPNNKEITPTLQELLIYYVNDCRK